VTTFPFFWCFTSELGDIKKPESEISDSGGIIYQALFFQGLSGNRYFQNVDVTPQSVTGLILFPGVNVAGFSFLIAFYIIMDFIGEVHNTPPFIFTAR
jgi:hypothetical protein